MDDIISSMVNIRKGLDKSIDEHVERFIKDIQVAMSVEPSNKYIDDNVDRVISRERLVEDGPNNEHYGEMTLEPIDVANEWLSKEQLEGAYLFQIIKYIGRYRMKMLGKGGKTDLLKMRDYLNLLIEMQDES